MTITEQLRNYHFTERQINNLRSKLNRRGFGFKRIKKIYYVPTRDEFMFVEDSIYEDILCLSATFARGE